MKHGFDVAISVDIVEETAIRKNRLENII